MQDPQPLPQLQIRNELPTLEPKNKVKINISQQGDIGFEAEGLTKEEAQELTYFALSVNSDNILRQRVITQAMKDNSEFLTHLITFITITGLILFTGHTVSRFLQPQTKPISEVNNEYRHIIRINY